MVKEAAPASQMVLVGNILFDTYCKCQHISEAEWGYSEEPILDATAPPAPATQTGSSSWWLDYPGCHSRTISISLLSDQHLLDQKHNPSKIKVITQTFL